MWKENAGGIPIARDGEALKTDDKQETDGQVILAFAIFTLRPLKAK